MGEYTHRPTMGPYGMEILRRVAAGDTAADIGAQMHLSERSVKNHMRRVQQHLGARNRCHAIALAYDAGLLTGGALSPEVILEAVAAALGVPSAGGSCRRG